MTSKKKVQEHNVVATFYVDSCKKASDGRHTFISTDKTFRCSKCGRYLNELKVTKDA